MDFKPISIFHGKVIYIKVTCLHVFYTQQQSKIFLMYMYFLTNALPFTITPSVQHLKYKPKLSMKEQWTKWQLSFKCNNNARKGEHQNLENKHKQIHWKSAHMPDVFRNEPHTKQIPLLDNSFFSHLLTPWCMSHYFYWGLYSD